MPQGDGAGVRGQGRGGGQGRMARSKGQDGERGKGRGGGMGAGEACICPHCKAVVPHQQGIACTSVTCPQCGASMMRKGMGSRQAGQALNDL